MSCTACPSLALELVFLTLPIFKGGQKYVHYVIHYLVSLLANSTYTSICCFQLLSNIIILFFPQLFPYGLIVPLILITKDGQKCVHYVTYYIYIAQRLTIYAAHNVLFNNTAATTLFPALP